MKSFIKIFSFVFTISGAFADANLDIQLQLLDNEIERLTAEKQQRFGELENCASRVSGFRIAGVSLIGLTAVGVGVNIYQSSERNRRDATIDNLEQDVERLRAQRDRENKRTACEQERMRQSVPNQWRCDWNENSREYRMVAIPAFVPAATAPAPMPRPAATTAMPGAANQTFNIDRRRNVGGDWARPPFRNIVMLPSPRCTGQYVAPNIIVTAAHCIKSNHRAENRRMARNYRGDSFSTRILAVNCDADCRDETRDWALLLVESPAHYAETPFRALPQSRTGPAQQAGFGSLKILSDQEIRALRGKFIEFARGSVGGTGNADFQRFFEQNMQNTRAVDSFVDFLDDRAARPVSAGGLGIIGIFDDGDNLKHNRSCTITRAHSVLEHNCYTSGGDSGSAIWTGDNELGGVHVVGRIQRVALGVETLGAAVSAAAFSNTLQQMMRENPPRR